MKAKDIMTTQVATATPDMSVRDVATLMLDKGISGIPVVDGEGQLKGLVSEGDLMRRVETGTDQQRQSWWLKLVTMSQDDAADYVKSHSTRVADVMTHPVISVSPDSDISEVAMLLEKHRIKRVPVVDGGRLVGLVSRADLLRALAVASRIEEASADDNTIRDRLLEHLEKQSWYRGTINVIVKDGIVNLWGVYEDASQHEAFLVAARETPGARGVEDHMMKQPLMV